MKSSLAKLRTDCDRLMQEIGKLKYPHSLISGKRTEVMHHLIPKSVSSILRYDWDNLIPLTNAEHCRLHQSPDPSIELEIVDRKGGMPWFVKLKLRSRQINKVNKSYYERIKLDLQNEKLRIQNPTSEAQGSGLYL